jgi:glycosyltransferase involved in cell wall biosynthesis
MGLPDADRLVLIPSYNSGPILLDTARAARHHWNPVWVIIDGSTDGSDAGLLALEASDPGLRVLRLPQNRGKGAAVLHGLRAAHAAGFSHALTMDSDGQHPADHIEAFMATSAGNPAAMVLCDPVFDAGAPWLRVYGRRISNQLARLETLDGGIDDCLSGFRVYPILPLLAVMDSTRWMRRFDFDTEAVVRLSWRGVKAINRPAPVRYPRPAEGGVSHFRYGRDNALLTWMHVRLLCGLLRRLPVLARRGR